MREKASPIVKRVEDKFCYAITEDCIGCLRAFSGKGITPRHLVTAGRKKGVAEDTPFLFCFCGCGLTPARRHLRG